MSCVHLNMVAANLDCLMCKNKCLSMSIDQLIYPNTTDVYMTLKFTSFIPRFIRFQANLCWWKQQRMIRNGIDCLQYYIYYGITCITVFASMRCHKRNIVKIYTHPSIKLKPFNKYFTLVFPTCIVFIVSKGVGCKINIYLFHIMVV